MDWMDFIIIGLDFIITFFIFSIVIVLEAFQNIP